MTMESDGLTPAMSALLSKVKGNSEERRERERIAASIRGPEPRPGKCRECGAPLPAVACSHGPCWVPAAGCQSCAEIAAERDRVEQRIASLGLATAHRHMTFEVYLPVTDSQADALTRMESGGSFWLVGTPGIGKSHLAIAACIAAAEAGPVHVERHVAPELFARIRDEAMGEGMEGTVRALCECDLLVLDDLDKARSTPVVLETVYRIAEARTVNRRRTILTTNGRPADVARIFGAAFVSRMRELCDVIVMEGPDARVRRGPA